MIERCPLCDAVVDPRSAALAVCGACGARLVGRVAGRVSGSTPVVQATAEFAVPELPMTASDAAIVTHPADACAWCGRGGDQVRKLLGTGVVAICDGCVALCVDILEAELGPGWK